MYENWSETVICDKILSIVKEAVVDKLSGLNFFTLLPMVSRHFYSTGFLLKTQSLKYKGKEKSGSIIVPAK